MSRPRPRPIRARRIFAWPIAIGVAGTCGLVLGLAGDGPPDIAAWLLVGIAPLVILRALLAKSPVQSASSVRKPTT